MTIPADITVHCGSQLHEFGPFAPAPEADYWINWHGCNESLACYGCVTSVYEAAQAKVERCEQILCPDCKTRFDLTVDYVKWKQL
ncbi:hypothetical protein [Nocardia africana]